MCEKPSMNIAKYIGNSIMLVRIAVCARCRTSPGDRRANHDTPEWWCSQHIHHQSYIAGDYKLWRFYSPPTSNHQFQVVHVDATARYRNALASKDTNKRKELRIRPNLHRKTANTRGSRKNISAHNGGRQTKLQNNSHTKHVRPQEHDLCRAIQQQNFRKTVTLH